jgi:ribose/xylose/arabinose/galactoside ABC-type transport system permease subunit
MFCQFEKCNIINILLTSFAQSVPLWILVFPHFFMACALCAWSIIKAVEKTRFIITYGTDLALQGIYMVQYTKITIVWGKRVVHH